MPAHFPTDEHGLAHFDGTSLYEHPDPRRGFHPDWSTAIYDFGRREVANFLISNALYWLDRFHIDGLRVDAVASMLYLDYSRREGEWTPNPDGSNDNRDAIHFLQRFNELVYGLFPWRRHHRGRVDRLGRRIATDQFRWPRLRIQMEYGLDERHAFLHVGRPGPSQMEPQQTVFWPALRLTENFVLPLSHDEVVHGKGSIVSKMPGDEWRRFANARAYYGFMWGHPGKKLLFMGQEFGQTNEWNAAIGLDWWLLDHAPHRGLQAFIRDLNRIYRDHEALYARDCEGEGFQWIVVDDAESSVYAFARFGADRSRPTVVVSNFTPVVREAYRLGFPRAGRWREILNSDASVYGGSGLGNLGAVAAHPQSWGEFSASADILLPPLSTLFFEFESDSLQ